MIAEQHDAIEAKDAAIAERDAALADKDGLIASQWRVISELDYRVDDLAASKTNPATENSDPRADEAASDTGNDVADAMTPGRADQSSLARQPDTGDEEQAGQAGIDGRTTVLDVQEEKQPAREQKRLRLPSNEAAGFFFTGVAGVGIAVASATHYLGGDGAVITGAVAACIATGVPWINKIWKRDANANRSEDRGTDPENARPRDSP